MTSPASCAAAVPVAIALIWRDAQLLVALRPTGALEGGRWEFPGGKLEPGETAADAVVRECREELDVTVAPLGLAWRSDVRRAGGALTLLFFHVALPAAAQPRALAADALQWVSVAQLGSLPFCSADAELLAALADGRVAPPAAV